MRPLLLLRPCAAQPGLCVAAGCSMRAHQIWSRDKNYKFQRRLLRWYSTHKRVLPWRNRPTPYRVWISEIMLQQTQVQTVLPYYERFIKRFPDVAALAAATEDEVLRYWAGLGYYSRARNLHRAANMIMQEYAGHFPRQLEDMLELPGIGRYTAGAIRSIAFNHPEPAVDGNVRRVLSRLHGIEKDAPEGFFWEQAASWVPADRASDFNQAVMELGALLCTPARPCCRACPARSLCQARRRGIQDRIPPPRAVRPPEEVELVVLVLEHRGRILTLCKPAESFIPGRWTLPLENLDPAGPPDAAARILLCRFNPKSLGLRECGFVRHSITHRRIFAHVFRAESDSAVLQVSRNQYRWISIQESKDLLTSSLFKKALQSALGFSEPPATSS